MCVMLLLSPLFFLFSCRHTHKETLIISTGHALIVTNYPQHCACGRISRASHNNPADNPAKQKRSQNPRRNPRRNPKNPRNPPPSPLARRFPFLEGVLLRPSRRPPPARDGPEGTPRRTRVRPSPSLPARDFCGSSVRGAINGTSSSCPLSWLASPPSSKAETEPPPEPADRVGIGRPPARAQPRRRRGRPAPRSHI